MSSQPLAFKSSTIDISPVFSPRQWINPVYASIEPSIPTLQSISFPTTFTLTANDFLNAKVINQVDRKFILISIPIAETIILALIDQHAADERYRLERILKSLPTTIHTVTPSIPLAHNLLSLSKRKQRLLRWGIQLEFVDNTIVLKGIPAILADLDVARWNQILSRYMTEDKHDCPTALMELFCSKACRSVSS